MTILFHSAYYILMEKKFEQLNKMIGNTPFIKIRYIYKGKPEQAFFKLEYYSLTGSIKDRVAFQILKDAYLAKKLHFGQTIIETTSGNMGISLAAIGAYLGNHVVAVMPSNMSEERKKLLKLYGAKLVLVDKKEGAFIASLKKARLIQKLNKGFLTLQFENKSNVATHYNTTACEIIESSSKNKTHPQAFIAGVGTGGTLIGVSKRLKERYKDIKIFAVEPKYSPVLREKRKVGHHKIQGISDEFVPKLYDSQLVDDILDVSDEDAIMMAQMLAKKLGLGVGISSGANFIGCVIAQNMIPSYTNVISIFPDDNKKYLSTSLTEKIDKNMTQYAKDIQLVDFEVL